jgi:hypothetical protein
VGRTFIPPGLERVAAFRRALRWVAEKSGPASRSGGEESDDRRFVPSRLDFSVRSSHGSGDTEAARELQDIEETAQKLEGERRDR